MESLYYTSEELAVVVNMSLRWVVKWRARIVGAQKIGGQWRFDRASVNRRIAAKKDIRSGF